VSDHFANTDSFSWQTLHNAFIILLIQNFGSIGVDQRYVKLSILLLFSIREPIAAVHFAGKLNDDFCETVLSEKFTDLFMCDIKCRWVSEIYGNSTWIWTVAMRVCSWTGELLLLSYDLPTFLFWNVWLIINKMEN
jgi:hypothetical protein